MTMATAKRLVEHEVWMRLKLHSSVWQATARWASSDVRWAMEMAGDADGRLLGFTVYDAKVLGDGVDQAVALEAKVVVPARLVDEFDDAADLILGILDDGFAEINRRSEEGLWGYRLSYS